VDTAGFFLVEEETLAGFFAAMAGFFITPFGIVTVQLKQNTAYKFEQEIGSEMLK